MRRRRSTILLAATLAICTAACTAPRTVKLRSWTPPPSDSEGPGYRYGSLRADDNSDSLFVCLAFSGGGTRAAALAYGVMEELRSTPIVWEGRRTTLLDEVDCISSVSGGSFTAAYYGLFKDRLFTDFRAAVLDRNIQGALIVRALSPTKWPWLLSPYFSRIDLAAEFYDGHVFDHATYADLRRQGKPFVVLNATNVATGARFPFTQDQFDLIGSDLDVFPVARAVAASSAFPLLLSPLTLENHQPIDGYSPPETYRQGLKAFYRNRSRYDWARRELEYVETPHPYVHLLDGGLADNTGLRSITNGLEQTDGFIARRQHTIKRLVVVVVNAKTRAADRISDIHRTPHVVPTVAMATGTIAMDNYSDESVDFLRRIETEYFQAGRARDDCQRQIDRRCPGKRPLPKVAPLPHVSVIEVNFDAIEDRARRDYFLRLPTSFALAKKDVDALIAVGHELLRQDPQFQALKSELAQ